MNGIRLRFEGRGERGTFTSDIDGSEIDYDWSDQRQYGIVAPGVDGRACLYVWNHGGACVFHDGSMLIDRSSKRGRGSVRAVLEYAASRWKLDRPSQLDLFEVAS